MANKKTKDVDMLSFEPNKNVGVKKNANNIVKNESPKFYISDEPIISNRDKFNDIKNAIYNLPVGKTLIITNENTGLTITELKKKLANMVFGHARKFTEKNFSTLKIDDITFSVTRNKDKTN